MAGKGKLPFILKVQFQVYDMKGKPGEQGVLTYWWAALKGSAVMVTSQHLGEVHSLGMNPDQTPEQRREVFLVGQLLHSVISPASILYGSESASELKAVRTGQVDLRCVSTPSAPNVAKGIETFQMCVDDRNTVREVITGRDGMIRNKDGVFAGTHVALDILDVEQGLNAIGGHVTVLHSFDPTQEQVDLVGGETEGSAPPAHVAISGKVTAGQKIGGQAPVYPYQERQERVSGTVLLQALISKEGKIALLTPIASPNQGLTRAAIDAVGTWTYKPYLLNGQPVEVQTTITINFNIRG